MPAAISKNGIASPAEKIVSNNPPWSALVEVEANKSTEPKIGPTHGVHPNAKALPKMNELDARPRFSKAGVLI